jgi:hypothetical protein
MNNQQGGQHPPRTLDSVTAQERLDLMMLGALVNNESQTINRLASVDSSSSRLFVPPVGKEMVLNHLTETPAPQPQQRPQAPLDIPPLVAGQGGAVMDGSVQASVARSLSTIATQLEILNQTIQSLIIKR